MFLLLIHDTKLLSFSEWQNYTLAELDEKINALKQTLLRKTNEGRPKVVNQFL